MLSSMKSLYFDVKSKSSLGLLMTALSYDGIDNVYLNIYIYTSTLHI